MQKAGLGGIGASQFGRSWRAVRLRIARVSRDVGIQLIGQPSHRVEARIEVIARQQPRRVRELKLLVIVAPANRGRERLGEIQGVGEEQPVIVGGGGQIDRGDVEQGRSR